MSERRDPTAERLRPFGTTIFATMTALAESHSAINLAQGFPDFEGPASIITSAVEALRSGDNQYARSRGHPRLVEAAAAEAEALYGLHYDPLTEVVVTSGATEGIASALLGLLNPGDEVVLFEPYYDSYPAVIAMAQAVPRFVTLEFPSFEIDFERLEALLGPRTRVLLLNTPHNPSGKVFSRAELERLAELCERHDILILSDEVYEHLTFAPHVHVPPATIAGLRERTVSFHSAGKTFSFTGWKVGWVLAPAALASAVQAAHQFITFATTTPLQIAVARALSESRPDYLEAFRRDYAKRRQVLAETLESVGFRVVWPGGAFFVLGEFSALWRGDDQSFARHLIEKHGVAAIPPSVFYAERPEEGRRLLRFSFAKELATLEAAALRLRGLVS